MDVLVAYLRTCAFYSTNPSTFVLVNHEVPAIESLLNLIPRLKYLGIHGCPSCFVE